jgi:hypothetical protein
VAVMPKTSAEAVGGTKAEAEREAKMKAEVVHRPPPKEHEAPAGAEPAVEAAPAPESSP